MNRDFEETYARAMNAIIWEGVRKKDIPRLDSSFLRNKSVLDWYSGVKEYLINNNIFNWQKEYFPDHFAKKRLESNLSVLEKVLEGITNLTWYEFSRQEDGIYIASEVLSQYYFEEVFDIVSDTITKHGLMRSTDQSTIEAINNTQEWCDGRIFQYYYDQK